MTSICRLGRLGWKDNIFNVRGRLYTDRPVMTSEDYHALLVNVTHCRFLKTYQTSTFF